MQNQIQHNLRKKNYNIEISDLMAQSTVVAL
jgi:aryl carrier-like protein